MTYQLGDRLDGHAVRRGTNLLVTGPPLSGKRELARNVAEHGLTQGEGTIVISLRDTADRVRGLVDGGADDQRVGVVDCVSERVLEADAGSELTSYVSSPTDVTGIGVEFADFVEQFHCERGLDRNRVVVDSVTMLLQYVPFQTAFRFLHAVTRRIGEVDAVGVFLVESSVHDEETMGTIRDLFDASIATAREGGLDVEIPDEAHPRRDT